MQAILNREIITDRISSRIFGIAIFVILNCLGAFVRIPLPFTPVPLTLQTFFVLLSGALLGAGCGAMSQLGYIMLGLSGLPVFAGANFGAAYLFGPTGGYLIGFVLASFMIGRAIKYCKNNFFLILLTFILADLLLLLSGVFWLKLIFGYPTSRLFLIGLIPFLPGDILKATAAALLYLRLQSRIKEIF
jgi:biotin transport system substrate-specific component